MLVALLRDLQTGGSAEALAIEERLLEAATHDAPIAAEPRETRAARIAREAIEAHPELPLRFSDVARLSGVSAPYLARAFRRAAGTTMGAHLRALRARRAAALLASSEDAIAEIALRAGFADQSHLTRVFKRAYGLSPLRYRRLMQGSNSFKN